MILQYLTTLKLIGIYLFLIPILLGGSLSLISRHNKQLIVNIWGVKAQLLLGGIGVIIHELSHSLVAVLFGHRITRMRLLHFPNPHDPNDNSLGSVDHSWNNHSLYQRVGNVFIGIAPIVGNTAVLILITNWLMPGILSWFSLSTTTAAFSWSKFFIWLILVININIGGFDLSSADLKNSGSGLLTLLTIILIVSFFVSLFTTPAVVSVWLRSWLSWVYIALAISLVLDLITLAILTILTWRE
ncbi:MAG: hypothetical protein H9843_03625 [Candidatus Limosilactobacillus merdavium]|uniref:Uncharacterized protein n=1 Tax=Candidatus Limosilactobacillus merdavium TaxID=2838651 RepID=A0A9E2NV83_9LACO|nr:hypothetical protein [Candidatus Limosilactobacillus merdavium]